MPDRRARWLLGVVLSIGLGAATAAETSMPTRSLQVGTRIIKAEVASTANERMRGLMHRRQLAPDAGMLFVFGREQGGEVCMWMRNTNISLSAAFLEGDGKIINVADMQPHTDDMHCAQGRAEYVLEVNQGVFAAAGVKPGMRVGGLPAAR